MGDTNDDFIATDTSKNILNIFHMPEMERIIVKEEYNATLYCSGLNLR